MAGRKIRDERDARRCMAAAKAAGVSRGEWGRQHGIDGRSLCAWGTNLDRGGKTRATRTRATKTPLRKRRKRGRVVELVAGASPAGGRYLIRCGELGVEVDDNFDEATLGRLLRVIAAC